MIRKTANTSILLDKLWLTCKYHDDEQTSIKKPDELGITNQDFADVSKINPLVVDRIKGSMFGLALGDALGAHVEFRPNSFLAANPVKDLVGGGTWGLQAGQVGEINFYQFQSNSF